MVVPLADLFGFDHAWMDGMSLDTDASQSKRHSCSSQLTGIPPGPGNPLLHVRPMYLGAINKNSDFDFNMSFIGVEVSYTQDLSEAAKLVKEHGWRLVGTVFEEESFFGGPQVSHLVQHPQTLECIVTFQGSDSWKDFMNDANILQVDFCSLDEK